MLSKILTIRLGPMLPKLISEEQSDVTKGRSITDNVLLAQELLQKLEAKTRGGNIVLKLDLAKAYDRIS